MFMSMRNIFIGQMGIEYIYYHYQLFEIVPVTLLRPGYEEKL